LDFWNAQRPSDLPKLKHVGERDWNPATVFHRNDPYMRIFSTRAIYLKAIGLAKGHGYLTHVSFDPDQAM
jgi:cardiolipin synthase